MGEMISDKGVLFVLRHSIGVFLLLFYYSIDCFIQDGAFV